MFTGGLGFQYGAEKLGALTVPAAAGNTKRQIKFITDFGTTCLHIIPSYATRLAEVMYEEGIDPRKDTKLHTVCIGAEPHSEEQRKRIEQLLGVKAYNCFGMSEMNGPGVAFECTEQNGLHIWEDNVIVEIVDPVTLQPVPEGEVGELVLTTINREAMPLLRYRTRDLTCILPGDCPCGRTHKRLARFKGRSDDMIILKGVNLFPIQIEKILMQFKELGSNYLITLETIGNSDEMLIEVELSDLFTDDYSALQRLTKGITRQLKDELLLTPRIKLVAKGSLPTTDGKAVRVKDHRISIFLENKYGKLSEILALLAEERIRIIAATVADTSEYGILRIIVSDPQKAYKILKENNVSANLTDVLAIVTSSCAGSFANTLSYFTKAGISIEYMYCFSIREKAILILRTNNRESAREVIRHQNLEYICESDLIKL